MEKSKGFIKLFRNIRENPIWESEEPFDMRSAWIDLLLMASWNDHQIMDGKTPLTLHKGELKTSITSLTERWNWKDRKKTRKFLNSLVELEMIRYENNKNGTVVLIENYDKIEGRGTTTPPTSPPTSPPTAPPTSPPQRRIIKNNKEEEKEKKKNSRWGERE